MALSVSAARAGLSLALALSIVSAAAAEGQAPHWDYAGEHGPAKWAQLDPGFEACAIGKHQSPIDIRKAVPADLPALQFHYGAVTPALLNNGHTFQANVPAGQYLEIGGERFDLVQFHFHRPSEEQVNGKTAAMVAHLVHRNAAGKLAVVGVLLDVKRGASGFDQVLSRLTPKAGEPFTPEGFQLDLPALLPARLDYYDFEGSLTTPPCSEGVHWIVLKQHMSVSATNAAAFQHVFGRNARPVQPLNGREVRVSRGV
jgi:carbonic anhydrase